MIPSSPVEELDDLFMSTLFILSAVIEMTLLRQSTGGGLDSQGCHIHRGRPGFSGMLYP